MVGTFVKLASVQVIEMLALLGFDFVVIDDEHAPLDRAAIDILILAGRAYGMATVVRIADPTDASILSVLDSGAAGVMIPHVDSPEKAKRVARACRYRDGARGYGAATRASRYGAVPMFDHVRQQDEEVVCIAMIEDLAAVESIDLISRTAGIDALFLGRGDLAVALGEERSDALSTMTRQVADVARSQSLPLMGVAGDEEDLAMLETLGVRSMIFASDYGFLQAGARAALKRFGR